MYCKYCGGVNDERGSYCINCGKKTKSIQFDGTKDIHEEKSSFCKKCGAEVAERYCTNCGAASYTLEIKETRILNISEFSMSKEPLKKMKKKASEVSVQGMKKTIKDKVNVNNIKEYIKSNANFKQASLSALIILGASLLLSLLLFFVIKNIEPITHALENFDEMPRRFKPNFIDLFNLSWLLPLKISANVKESGFNLGANITIYLKLLWFMFIPIVSVLISQLKRFKDDKSTVENLTSYSLTALIFSIIVGLIAFISRRNISGIAGGYFGASFKGTLGFGDLSSLVSVFLLVLVIQMIISGLIKRDNPFAFLNISEMGNLGSNVLTYIKSMSGFAIIVAISLIIAFVSIKNDLGRDVSWILGYGLLFSPILFIQSWLFSSGYTISFSIADAFPINSNLWTLFSEVQGTNLIWSYLVIFGLIVGLIYIAYKSVRDIDKNSSFFLKLSALAGSISIISILLSRLVNMKIKLKNTSMMNSSYDIKDLLYKLDLEMLAPLLDSGSMSIGYGFINIIIVTFIWILTIGSLVYILKNKGVFEKINPFIEKNRKIIIAIYSLMMVIFFSMAIRGISYELSRIIMDSMLKSFF